MQSLQQFDAAKKEYQLTESEAQSLRRELMDLRQEFVQNTGFKMKDIDESHLLDIEQKMYSIEHKLAHAEIIRDEIKEPDMIDFAASIIAEIQGTASALKVKLLQKIHHNSRHAQSKH